MIKAKGLDWRGMMRVGLHELGLSPADFWALTPAELMVMVGRDTSPAGFSRATLEALVQRYPDAPTTEKREKQDDNDHGSGRRAGPA